MTSASSFSVLTSQKCNHKLICLCYALDPSPLEGIDSLGEIYAGFKYLCFSGSCGFRRNHRPFAKCCSSPLQQGSLPQHGPSGSSGNNFPPASHLLDASVLSTSESDHRRQWMPKMEFPRFDGTDVRIWLDKCAA
jgi:hypothetical protein